ncbi:UDP-N-acetylglucosamine 2-epimerase [Photorhabdus antumapuensis]|uniref:UDP-N-acetylglucosamine 2-epimerase n=1 Tax=Photorhabdus antumapuensis TaxID=2862867 RepID=UPI001CED7B7C|nr:UDP-N-acetylglucosamine 2-epimerase [Photorhabdus antumapuensis]MCA6222238.1 UDP-N-acetylglucosamine 2-epimerase [Photorhabdus antumapuensis]
MKEILFICYGGGHVKMLLPIIQNIKNNNKYKINIIALTTARSVLDKYQINSLGFNELSFLVKDDRWKTFGKELVYENQISPLINYNESIAYYGINYLDLVLQYGSLKAKEIYKYKDRQSFYPINFISKIISYFNPDLVIATNSPRSEKCAIDVATTNNIKSLCIVDMFALQEIKWIGKNNFATKICVLNDSIKNMFVQYGRKENDIIVTGNPAFDSLFDIDNEKIKQYLCQKNLSKSKIKILYASQPEPQKHPFNSKIGDPNLPRIIEKTLREFIKENKQYELIIRYHPSENIIYKEQKNVKLSSKDEDLHILLHSIDLIIVTASTVGLEAHLIGKPVITIDNSIFTDDAPFSKMGISTGVKEISELPNIIHRIASKLCEPYNKNYNYSRATENIISVINNMLE